MELELRHLRIVQTIARAGSITQASVQLGLSQPALTAQLRRIERMVCGELFYRERSGTRPTALGALVLSRAESVLPVIDELQRSFQQVNTEGVRRIRLGCDPGRLGVRLLSVVRGLFSDAEVTLDAYQAPGHIPELVADGRLEGGLISNWPGIERSLPAAVAELEIHTEPVFVMLPERHRLADQPVVELGDLAEDRWLMDQSEDNDFERYFWSCCQKAGFQPLPVREMPWVMAAQLIGMGDAVGLVQALTPPQPGTVVRPLAGTPLSLIRVLLAGRHGILASRLGQVRTGLIADFHQLAAAAPAYQTWLTGQADADPSIAGEIRAGGSVLAIDE